jgi:YqeC protein
VAALTLVEALGIGGGDVVALVGGGGKTSAMFRLARELAARGELALTTSTTHIFAEQIALAPAHVRAADAGRDRVVAALDVHRHVLVIGASDPATGRAAGIPPALFRDLRAWCSSACLLNEADGSRGRPFKAPAPHEPAIPPETTVARVVADLNGGRRNVPAGARVVVLINKAEMLADREPAREAAERLMREPAIASVVLGAAAGDKPVLEVFTR